MYIQLERDWTANDNKGLYVHIYDLSIEGVEGDIALIRIENGSLIWYESQNGECLCDSAGDFMTEDNIRLVCEFLRKQFPDSDIDTGELSRER